MRAFVGLFVVLLGAEAAMAQVGSISREDCHVLHEQDVLFKVEGIDERQHGLMCFAAMVHPVKVKIPYRGKMWPPPVSWPRFDLVYKVIKFEIQSEKPFDCQPGELLLADYFEEPMIRADGLPGRCLSSHKIKGFVTRLEADL